MVIRSIVFLLFLLSLLRNSLLATNLNPTIQELYVTSTTFSWDNYPSVNYNWQISTDNFQTLLSYETTSSNSITITGLKGNTTYWFRVKISTEGESSYSNNTISTITLTAAVENPSIIKNLPSILGKAKVNIAFISLNSDDTLHQIDYSTSSSFEISATSTAYISGNPPFEIDELKTNTTYYFKIKPIDKIGRDVDFSSTISTQTIAKLPETLSFEIFVTSVVINWTPVNGTDENGSNGYLIELKDENNNSINQIRITNPDTSSFSLTDLSTNTQYNIDFSVLNSIEARNSENISIYTLAPKPENLIILNITSTTAKLSWNLITPTNQVDGYILEASTNSNFNTIYTSSSTTNTLQDNLTLEGLLPNTTYFFRVGSLNKIDNKNYSTIIDTMTFAAPLHNSVINYIAEPFSIKAQYEKRPPPTNPWGTYGYIFEVSTKPFTDGIIYSSFTDTNEVSTLTITGLKPNVLYYARIGTLNGRGAISYSTPVSVLTPFPSVNLNPYVVSYTSSTITISYSTASTDGYVAEASTEEGYINIVNISSTTDNQQAILSLIGLENDKIYYLRVGAIFSGSTKYFEITNPVRTLVTPPQITSFNIYITSVQASWNIVSNSKGYFFEASTSTTFSPKQLSYTTFPTENSLTINDLIPNTSYYFRVGSLNSNLEPNYTTIPQTSTLANFPIELDLSNLTTYSMQINYSNNSNPSDTLYLVEISSTNFLDHPLSTKSSYTYNNYAYFEDLNPNTTYYKRITAFNRYNIPTGPINFTPIATLAYKVTNLTHMTSTRTIVLNWEDNSNSINTLYLAEVSSDNFITIISSYTLMKSATFYNLNGNTIYKARVSALNFSLLPSEYEILITTTRVEIPAVLNPTYLNILLDGFTAQWSNNSNSTHTVYIIESSTNSNFIPIFRTTETKNTTIVFGNLNFNTQYYLRIKARGINNEESDYLNLEPITTLYRAEKIINHTITNTLSIPFSYGLIEVIIPAYSLGSTTRLFIEPITQIPPPLSNAAILNPTNYAAKIYIRPEVLFTGPVTIKIPYKPDDNSFNLNKAIIARYDEDRALWIPLKSRRISNYIVAETYGFSIFAIMELDAGINLDNVKIYPNPYKPNTNPGYMTFSNLPPDTDIYIHTLNGELIKKLKTDNGGIAQWDGKNSNGRDIASGVYLVVIKTPDGKKIIKKIGIEK